MTLESQQEHCDHERNYGNLCAKAKNQNGIPCNWKTCSDDTRNHPRLLVSEPHQEYIITEEQLDRITGFIVEDATHKYETGILEKIQSRPLTKAPDQECLTCKHDGMRTCPHHGYPESAISRPCTGKELEPEQKQDHPLMCRVCDVTGCRFNPDATQNNWPTHRCFEAQQKCIELPETEDALTAAYLKGKADGRAESKAPEPCKYLIDRWSNASEINENRNPCCPNVPVLMNRYECVYLKHDAQVAHAATLEVLDEFSELFEQLGNLHYLQGNKIIASAYYGAMIYTKRAKFPESENEHKEEIKAVKKKIESLRIQEAPE
jgi:hypothetical protein